MDVVADTSRAAAELDWHPRASLADGIAAVVAAERAARG
jgi:nucleoside-diphosphate-sugar epimerase